MTQRFLALCISSMCACVVSVAPRPLSAQESPELEAQVKKARRLLARGDFEDVPASLVVLGSDFRKWCSFSPGERSERLEVLLGRLNADLSLMAYKQEKWSDAVFCGLRSYRGGPESAAAGLYNASMAREKEGGFGLATDAMCSRSAFTSTSLSEGGLSFRDDSHFSSLRDDPSLMRIVSFAIAPNDARLGALTSAERGFFPPPAHAYHSPLKTKEICPFLRKAFLPDRGTAAERKEATRRRKKITCTFDASTRKPQLATGLLRHTLDEGEEEIYSEAEVTQHDLLILPQGEGWRVIDLGGGIQQSFLKTSYQSYGRSLTMSMDQGVVRAVVYEKSLDSELSYLKSRVKETFIRCHEEGGEHVCWRQTALYEAASEYGVNRACQDTCKAKGKGECESACSYDKCSSRMEFASPALMDYFVKP